MSNIKDKTDIRGKYPVQIKEDYYIPLEDFGGVWVSAGKTFVLDNGNATGTDFSPEKVVTNVTQAIREMLS